MSSIMSGAPGCIRAIRRRIEESLVTSISKQRFLPRDKLYEIFTLPTIKGAVQELNCGAEYRIKLLDTINNDCKILFAILIYNRLEDYITEFRRHGFLDSQLPLTKERAEEIMGSEFGPRLALDFQWMFLPYVFRKSMLECSHQIGERYILPFITAEQIGTGAFGDVDKVGVLPSQHEFPVQGTTELHVVRKRLRFKGRMEEFNREDKCLRLLNRLKHQNIIPLLGSYTYGEEHSFLFPYFSMNLDEFLRAKERPGDFRWNFTFCSALAGLASALSKMHRLHLNEEEHDVDLEAVGYHHDLRPPNVLVSENTFILADFGLGSLKDRAALSHTPYKTVGGDYIAPECTDMDENPQTVNRSIDVWAFGCLILEIITYIVKGPDGIQEFRKKRLTKGRLQQFKDAGFYKPDGELKQEVVDWTEELKSLNPHKDLLDRLLPLSLDCLQPVPRDRPNMDEVNQRLSALSVQEHFDSVQHMFLKAPDAVDQSPSLQHHVQCLQLAQRRFQSWGDFLGLTKERRPNFEYGPLELSVNIMRSLFHILREDQDKRASGDTSALRWCQHQTDHYVKQLRDSLPDGSGESIQKQSTNETVADSGLLEQVSSLPGKVNEDMPSVSLVTNTDAFLSEFEEVAQSFKGKLPNSVSLDEVIEHASFEKLYDVTDKLQADQELRNLSRIKQYLQRLRSYAEFVEAIFRGNHEFLAFLWGPLALLLLWSSKDDKAYRSIIDVVAEMGKGLPDFQAPETELGQNLETKEILVLLFKDILNFYLVALKPFSHPGWMCIFNYTWPKHLAMVSKIASHVNRLTQLMRTEMRLELIQQEHEFWKVALERSEKQAEENRKQEFSRIETSLNLFSYGDDIYRHRGVRSTGTGTWLFTSDAYTSWLGGSQGNSRIIWLVGIPGAGKTVLSCAVVDHLRTIQPKSTGFAFLTYENEKTTAISVINFLIFQLAKRDDDLMEVVCESSDEDLKTDLAVARSLFTSLIQNSGPVSLVIDGIDEISMDERGRLVTELLELAEVCKDLRIVLSSRPEADLVHKLDSSAVSIRIHDHNEESISAYVSQRSQQLFEKLCVPVPEQAEIKKLVVPIGSRAKGMFLYARLVMDMIEDVHDLSGMQNELAVLPESLDAAYHRIIIRLGYGKDKRKAERAHRLLGWVACSPSPLTVEEAGQALALNLENRDQVYRVISKFDAVRELGPIVETIDGCIRFVHFTAKEYVFSPHLGPQLIDKDQATLDLAIRCISYLCQRHHDLDLLSEDVSENVLRGQYSFHAFSTQMWFELSCRYLRSAKVASLPPHFVESLQTLWRLRSTSSYQIIGSVGSAGEEELSGHQGSKYEIDLKPLEQQHPLLHQLLSGISRFRTSAFTSTGKSMREPHKNEDDPLTISEISQRIRRAFDAELCNEPQACLSSNQPVCQKHCARILFYYGSKPFKCEFPQCERWLDGFESRGLRDKHRDSHDLPWKCFDHNCKFAQIGFLSCSMRKKHIKDRHQDGQLESMIDTRNINKDNVEPLLSDLVQDNQVEAVRKVLATCSIETYDTMPCRLALLAAYAASGAMLDVLNQAVDKAGGNHYLDNNFSQRFVLRALQGRNRSTMEYLMTRYTPLDDTLTKRARDGFVKNMCQVVSMDWTEGTEMWCNWYRKRAESSTRTISQLAEAVRDLLTVKAPIKAAAAAKHRGGEQRLVYIWKRPEFQPLFDNSGVLATVILRHVAKFSCSTSLAEYLLEKGAHINARGRKTERTALHCAAERDSSEGAHMLRFLLQHGADPEVGREMRRPPRTLHSSDPEPGQEPARPRRRIRDEVGPKNIHKWLGKDWDELIEETKMFRDNYQEESHQNLESEEEGLTF